MRIALVFCRIDNLFAEYKAGVFSLFESNPPLGLGAIGTIATEMEQEVKIFDQLLHNQNNEELIESICDFEPDMVGFSCTSLNIENSIICAKRLKSLVGSILFAGGIHITLCTKEVLKKEVFDFLISGEGEQVFKKVIESLIDNKKINDIEEKGLWVTGSDKDCGTAVLTCVDQPILNRKIFELELYKNKGALLDETPCFSIFSSRGCPFTCKFCSKPDYFKIYRQRQIDNVIEEIHDLIDNYGAKSISFREDNFTVDIDRLKKFCERMIYEFGGDFYWECESRADLPTEVIQLMYNAGCRGIWCGVETIVPRWSEWINKGLKRENVEKFYSDCKNIGIKTGALFMFGFPTQTAQEIQEDINFAISLPTVFSAFQCLAIFPGSPLEEFYIEHPNLKHDVTSKVALALTEGYTYEDMIMKELEINRKIKSNRIKD